MATQAMKRKKKAIKAPGGGKGAPKRKKASGGKVPSRQGAPPANRARGLARRPAARNYAASKSSELFADFRGTTTSPDESLRGSLRTMRARSRQLGQDDGYAKKFFALVETNIVGPRGIRFQSRAALEDGSPDKAARQAIESAWERWGKLGTCDVTRGVSWPMACRQMVSAVARDGEVLIVEHFGYANEFGFALQILEADYLDETLWIDLRNGSKVRMAVEQNSYGAPIAYHLRTQHPGETSIVGTGRDYVRVPADRVIHLRLPGRPQQSRGVPWTHTAMLRLKMLGGYEDAELVASRVAAAKMGFYTSPSGDAYTGDDQDEQGNVISETEPGMLEQLPEGSNFHAYDPQHPVGAFGDFVRAMLRGTASSLSVAYHSLASDPSDANYGSQRGALLEERDHWRTLQAWFVEVVCERVFRDWLTMAILLGAIPLEPRKIASAAAGVWQPRGWGWIDPLKDMQANELALRLRLTTRRRIVAQLGEDWDDILEEARAEEEALAEAGLAVSPEMTTEPHGEQDQGALAA